VDFDRPTTVKKYSSFEQTFVHTMSYSVKCVFMHLLTS